MKQEYLKNPCVESAHLVSSQDQCYYMYVWSTGDIMEENSLYTAFGWVKQQKLVKAAGTAAFYLVCLDQTFCSCSLTIYL